jgi:mRNA interferase MazF
MIPNGAKHREGISLSIKPPVPLRGEIWFANLDPTIGAEIKKKRPVIVISSDAIGKLPIKLIAPITAWDDRKAHNIWHVKIDPEKVNGLRKFSAVDTLQLRGIDVQRFLKKIGRISSSQLDEIAAAIAAVVEYQ